MTTTTTAPSSNDPIGYGLAVAGAILFSTKGIFIKLADGLGVSTEMLLSLRMLVALPVYLVILLAILRRGDKPVTALTLRLVLASMAVPNLPRSVAYPLMVGAWTNANAFAPLIVRPEIREHPAYRAGVVASFISTSWGFVGLARVAARRRRRR